MVFCSESKSNIQFQQIRVPLETLFTSKSWLETIMFGIKLANIYYFFIS